MRELASHAPGLIEHTIIAPQNWHQFQDAISTRQWDRGRRFLNVDKRPLLTELSLTDTYRVLDALEELLTNPNLTYDHSGYEVANETLSAFIEDFVKQESFPQKSYVDVYLRLLQLWSAYKTGSAKISDGQLLLALAYAVLLYRGDEKEEISGAIRQWWHTRKVRALAPFLLEALELLVEYTPTVSVCENLWIELAGLIRLDPTGYSPGEKSLLRQIGRRLNIGEDTIAQFLKLKSGPEDKSEDILARSGIGKVAIVSLHEKAASLAAKMIKERTKALVVLVTEKDAGPQTKNAKSANVILFVWSASKHAVYRAFDDVREKLAYVQGVGATSIVLALERWVMKNQEVDIGEVPGTTQ
jgi:hypothetical protein